MGGTSRIVKGRSKGFGTGRYGTIHRQSHYDPLSLLTNRARYLRQLGVRNPIRWTTSTNSRIVAVHQAPPTAKGFHFITLEDKAGLLDMIINPQVYAHHQRLLHPEALLIFEGMVQHQGGVVNLLAQRVTALPQSSSLANAN